MQPQQHLVLPGYLELDQVEVRRYGRIKRQKGMVESIRRAKNGHARPLLCGRVAHDDVAQFDALVPKEDKTVTGILEDEVMHPRPFCQEGEARVVSVI